MIVDNTEISDADIFDITDPRQPRFIADLDLPELAVDQGVDVVDDDSTIRAGVFRSDVLPSRHGGQDHQRRADAPRVVLGHRTTSRPTSPTRPTPG